MRFKIPLSYIFTLALILAIAVFIFLVWFNVIALTDLMHLYNMLVTAIVGWMVIILFAILGAFFIGLLYGHRILSIKGFTPFEKSVLEMKTDIEKINERLERIESLLDDKKES